MAEQPFCATLAASRSGSTWRRSLWTLATSTLLQGGVIVSLIVTPLLVSYSLPTPVSHLDLPTFIDARVSPPPPPPRRSQATPNPERGPTVPVFGDRLTPPAEFSDVILDEWSGPEVNYDFGVEGGVEGGVSTTGSTPFEPHEKPPAPTEPLRPGGNVRAPVKTHHVDPVYPSIAIAAGVHGIVILEATIDALGNVQNVRVLRSSPLLEAAAIDAVKQWKYAPTLLNGNPVPIIMTVTVSFNLERHQR